MIVSAAQFQAEEENLQKNLDKHFRLAHAASDNGAQFIIFPDESEQIYIKQHLHDGEDQYFTTCLEYNPQIQLGAENVSFAICADIDNKEHAETAYKSGTTLYAASIFFTKNGINDAHRLLSTYAAEFSISVLMANYCGSSWNLNAGGLTAFWDSRGKLIANMNEGKEGLLLVEENAGIYNGKILKQNLK